MRIPSSKLIIAFLVVAVLALGYLWHAAQQPDAPRADRAQLTPRVDRATPEPTTDTTTAKMPPAAPATIPAVDPQVAADFGNRWQNRPDVPDTEYATAANYVRATNLSAELRNNLANFLVGRQPHDPTLYQSFLDMLNDENEDPVWRIYCIQFAALCHPFADNQSRIVETLNNYVAHPEADFSGTAIMHLARLADEQEVELPDAFWTHLRDQSLGADPIIRTTALSLLADRPERASRSFWLACLEGDADVQRFGIRALGEIGTAEDEALLARYAGSYDFRIKTAARAAARRLTTRLKQLPN